MSSLPDPQPWAVRMAASMLRQHPVSAMRWCYEDGFLIRAVEEAGRPGLLEYADRWVQGDGSIHTYRLTEYSLDQVMPGRVLFAAYEATGEERYRRAIELLREQLRWQPRTRAGGFWHKLIYPYQMWLDGLYMAGPFLAQYAATCGEPGLFDDVAHQFCLIEARTCDPRTGLLYHAWDESRKQAWGCPETGCSPHFWGRAVGWYVMALVDVLDHLPPDHPQVAPLATILGRTLAALLAARDEESGLWRQVLDQGPRAGNYLEASAACMFVYALAKGVRRGYLPAEWRDIAAATFERIVRQFVRVDETGELHLGAICGTAGLGGTPYRDGSYAYYISERIVEDDPKGVAAFVLAGVETGRCGQTDQPAAAKTART